MAANMAAAPALAKRLILAKLKRRAPLESRQHFDISKFELAECPRPSWRKHASKKQIGYQPDGSITVRSEALGVYACEPGDGTETIMESSDIVAVIGNVAEGLRRTAQDLTYSAGGQETAAIDRAMPILHSLGQALNRLINDSEQLGTNSVLNAIDRVRERMAILPETERRRYDIELKLRLAACVETATRALELLQQIAKSEAVAGADDTLLRGS
jgi:hypothetical protein